MQELVEVVKLNYPSKTYELWSIINTSVVYVTFKFFDRIINHVINPACLDDILKQVVQGIKKMVLKLS